MMEYNLVHLETGYTRITQRSKSIIDLMFSDMSHIIDVGVRQFSISDHLPIYIIKKKNRNKVKKEFVEFRDMRNYTLEGLENLIRADERWRGFWDEHVSVDVLWYTMYSIFIEAVNTLCPLVRKLIGRAG